MCWGIYCTDGPTVGEFLKSQFCLAIILFSIVYKYIAPSCGVFEIIIVVAEKFHEEVHHDQRHHLNGITGWHKLQ